MVRSLPLSGINVEAARQAGINPDGLRHAFRLVAEWVRDGVLPGAAALVARKGRIAGEAYLGLAQPARGLPVSPDTIWSLASITKPFTAAAVMRLVEGGVISLDEPLYRLLPEFLDAPAASPDGPAHRRAVTLRHVLAHCSGLPGFSEDHVALRRARRPLEDFVRSFRRQPLFFPPGAAHLYSNPGILMAAEVVGRAEAGLLGTAVEAPAVRHYHDIVHRHLLAPLGMTDSSLLPPASWNDRFASVVSPGQDGSEWESSEAGYYRALGFPWGGLYSTPRDLIRFVDLFLPHTWDESRSAGQLGEDNVSDLSGLSSLKVLSSATTRAMIEVQFAQPDAPPDLAAGQRDSSSRRPPLAAMEWGIGWEIKGRKPAHRSGDLTSEATFGHAGATGTMVWGDPVCGVACVLLTNRPLGSGWATDPPRQARFSTAVMAALLT